MAQGDDNLTYDLPHFRIERFKESAQYVFPQLARDPPKITKDPQQHSARLIAELAVALGPLPAPGADTRFGLAGHVSGINIEIETSPPDSERKGPVKTPSLDLLGHNVRVLQSLRGDDRSERSIVFIPDDTRQFLTGRMQSYGVADTGNRKRPDVDKFQPIETIRSAPAVKLFVGAVDFAAAQSFWWEVWITPKNHADSVVILAQQQGLSVHAQRLNFPDTAVMFVRSTALALAQFLDRIPGVVTEVRKATGSLAPFLDHGDVVTPHDWVDDMANRILLPEAGSPTVCVLDSGVSGAHPLIEPGLAGAWAVDDDWGSDDHVPHGGHGTAMAGVVLHGDLFWPMNAVGELQLSHYVESVKLLPPAGFPPTRPPSYGAVTQAAVAVAEIERPEAMRTYCMAISATDFPPNAPSSWSGSIDQIASGAMTGDRQDGVLAKDHPKRLFMVATGNYHGGDKADALLHHALEDPAQSWNALSVGGFTTKDTQPDDISLTPLVEANSKSPFSCGSQAFPYDLTPIKPEVLFEAGNMVVDLADYCEWHRDVSLLAPGSDVANDPLVPFWATSAATAVAGNFIGRLAGSAPGLWPETYRALTVHSAQWPAPIRSKLIGRGAHWRTGPKSAKQLLLRDVGYGVPDLPRAQASALSDVALVAEAEIQPFTKAHGQATAVFNEVHFYALPWPRQALEHMANDIVTMKVTLSYFVEPNLTGRAATRPDTYRSFGLRFDLKKRSETVDQFRSRLSAPIDGMEVDDGDAVKEASHWLLGPKSFEAGSLHCDLWRGHGVDLATHDHIAIYPVGGWWKSHLGQQRYNDRGRYSLAISLTAENGEVDLYSEISAEIEARIQAEVEAELEWI